MTNPLTFRFGSSNYQHSRGLVKREKLSGPILNPNPDHNPNSKLRSLFTFHETYPKRNVRGGMAGRNGRGGMAGVSGSNYIYIVSQKHCPTL